MKTSEENPLASNTSIPVPTMTHTPTPLELAKASLLSDLAVTRTFTGADLLFDQKIIDSSCTYYGMPETLIAIKEDLEAKKIDPATYAVLCPRYATTSNPKWPGGDTQAGGGGKVARRRDKRTRNWIYETYAEATQNEVFEELRLVYKTSDSKLRYEASASGRYGSVHTKIYSIHISNCVNPRSFDPSTATRRGEDVYDSKVGYVVFGPISDCLQVLTDMPVASSKQLVDNIDAVSIISLPKAIAMAQGACKFLHDKKPTLRKVF